MIKVGSRVRIRATYCGGRSYIEGDASVRQVFETAGDRSTCKVLFDHDSAPVERTVLHRDVLSEPRGVGR